MSDPAGFNGLIGSRTCCSKCQIRKHQRSSFSPAIKNAQFVLLSLKKRNKSEDRPVSKVILASLFCLSSHFSRLSSISQNVEDSRATSVLTNTPNSDHRRDVFHATVEKEVGKAGSRRTFSEDGKILNPQIQFVFSL